MEKTIKKQEKEQKTKKIQKPSLNTVIKSIILSHVESSMEEGESSSVSSLRKEIIKEEGKHLHVNTLKIYLIRLSNDPRFNKIAELLTEKKGILGIRKRDASITI